MFSRLPVTYMYVEGLCCSHILPDDCGAPPLSDVYGVWVLDLNPPLTFTGGIRKCEILPQLLTYTCVLRRHRGHGGYDVTLHVSFCHTLMYVCAHRILCVEHFSTALEHNSG